MCPYSRALREGMEVDVETKIQVRGKCAVANAEAGYDRRPLTSAGMLAMKVLVS